MTILQSPAEFHFVGDSYSFSLWGYGFNLWGI